MQVYSRSGFHNLFFHRDRKFSVSTVCQEPYAGNSSTGGYQQTLRVNCRYIILRLMIIRVCILPPGCIQSYRWDTISQHAGGIGAWISPAIFVMGFPQPPLTVAITLRLGSCFTSANNNRLKTISKAIITAPTTYAGKLIPIIKVDMGITTESIL